MKNAAGILFVLCLSLHSPQAFSQINLKVKIAQIIGSRTIETVKNISTSYGQEIIIQTEGNLKEKIVLKLKKFKNIVVNGNKINPVQIDMKIISALKNDLGKTKTVTSFYNQSASFDSPDMNVSLNFEEI